MAKNSVPTYRIFSFSFYILDNMEEWRKNRVPTDRIFPQFFLNFRQCGRTAEKSGTNVQNFLPFLFFLDLNNMEWWQKNRVPSTYVQNFLSFFLNFRQYGRMTEKSDIYEQNFLPFFLNFIQYGRMAEKSGSYVQNFSHSCQNFRHYVEKSSSCLPSPFHLRNSAVRTTCRRLRMRVCFTASKSLGSDTRTFFARFQDR